ncbi:50S ribosomal protein L37ae, partial [Candidatus Marsarchaeota archaeon]|nr:50S ribosomal protein L37ae [Candidatus Marsarchaeota archaeon]
RYLLDFAQKAAHYKCEACGRMTVRRIGTSIWKCTHCGKVYAGGAYTMTTPAGEMARRQIENLNAQR